MQRSLQTCNNAGVKGLDSADGFFFDNVEESLVHYVPNVPNHGGVVIRILDEIASASWEARDANFAVRCVNKDCRVEQTKMPCSLQHR